MTPLASIIAVLAWHGAFSKTTPFVPGFKGKGQPDPYKQRTQQKPEPRTEPNPPTNPAQPRGRGTKPTSNSWGEAVGTVGGFVWDKLNQPKGDAQDAPGDAPEDVAPQAGTRQTKSEGCRIHLIPHQLQAIQTFVEHLSTAENKAAMWVKMRYYFGTNAVFPMNQKPYSWPGRAHMYEGWTAATFARTDAVVITGSVTVKAKPLPILGFVEHAAGNTMCVSSWDFRANTMQAKLLYRSDTLLAVYKY